MRIKQLLLPLLIFLVFTNLNSQEQPAEGRLVHAGINVTSVISSFTGNANIIEAADFPILFRFGKKKFNLRLGLGVKGSSKESFSSVTGSFRQSSEREAAVRFGFEKNLVRQGNFNVYWGLDFIGQYQEDRVEIFTFPSNILKDTTVGVGGGPILGVKYFLTDRLYLSSESTFYGLVNFEKFEESGSSGSEVNTTSYNFSLQPPIVLYLNYKL